MWFFPLDLILPHAVDLLGCAAAATTLLTFAQKRMWSMRISAIAANLFFIGYGAFGLLYPVLFLHLILLPLNVIRLVQLAQQATPHTTDPEPPRPILVPQPPQMGRPSAPCGRGDRPVPAGLLSARSPVWDLIKPGPP
jgi:hypothetical protein